MTKTPPPQRRIDVAAGLVWRAGRFLAAERPLGKDRAGFWEFPGGKREEGESMEETLRRELYEELGIRCLTVMPFTELTHEYPDVCVRLFFMHVTAFEGEPEPRDGQRLRWLTPEEAAALPFLPADRALLGTITPPG